MCFRYIYGKNEFALIYIPYAYNIAYTITYIDISKTELYDVH